MSAIIMDARVATIGKSVRAIMIEQDVLGSNPWDVLGSNPCEKCYHSCAFILKSFKNVLGSSPCEKVHSCAFRFESLRSQLTMRRQRLVWGTLG